MSRGTSPHSITYELNNSCDSYKEEFCKQDTLSQLKVQVFEKDQNKKIIEIYYQCSIVFKVN